VILPAHWRAFNYSAHYELGRVTFQVDRAQARSEGGSHD